MVQFLSPCDFTIATDHLRCQMRNNKNVLKNRVNDSKCKQWKAHLSKEEAQKNLRLNDYPSAINFVVSARVPSMSRNKITAEDEIG